MAQYDFNLAFYNNNLLLDINKVPALEICSSGHTPY